MEKKDQAQKEKHEHWLIMGSHGNDPGADPALVPRAATAPPAGASVVLARPGTAPTEGLPQIVLDKVAAKQTLSGFKRVEALRKAALKLQEDMAHRKTQLRISVARQTARGELDDRMEVMTRTAAAAVASISRAKHCLKDGWRESSTKGLRPNSAGATV